MATDLPAGEASRASFRSFWGARFNQQGHTGWKRTSIYVYDQCERLAFVERALSELRQAPGSALDFGCGSGDFSRLLRSRGHKVWAYDPYVHPKFDDPEIRFIGRRDELLALSQKFDIILCVTVLDHILDEAEFRAELSVLRSLLDASGRLVLLEYATDAQTQGSSYQAFRSYGTWQRALEAVGFHVDQVSPVPHPSHAPSAGYSAYARSLRTRVLGRLADRQLLPKALVHLLETHAKGAFRRFGLGSVDRSPLKLMVCTPRAASP